MNAVDSSEWERGWRENRASMDSPVPIYFCVFIEVRVARARIRGERCGRTLENRRVLSYDMVVVHPIMFVISTIYVVDTRRICVCSSMPHPRIPIGAGWDTCGLYQVKGEETGSLLGKSKLAFCR